MTRFHVACLQTRPMPDFETALDEALDLAREAASRGANFLALPEYCGGLRTRGASFDPPATEENAHPVLAGLRAFARERRLWMLIGSLAVTAPGGRIFNRAFVLDDHGEIRSRYDKIHLFDIQLSETEVYRESATVAGGSLAALVDTPFGRIGYTICYDLRFPQLYRALAQAGAEILAVPAAFTRTTGEAHWHVLNRARAIENCAFLIAPCAIGPVEGGGESYGHSLIVDPWGRVLADGGNRRCVIDAEIDLGLVAATRKRIPSLTHDRAFTIRSDEMEEAG
jgi:deaminated glutathione amidase